MVSPAFSMLARSLNDAQDRALRAAGQISQGGDIAESFVDLKMAELQTKVAAKSLRALDETSQSVLDILA